MITAGYEYALFQLLEEQLVAKDSSSKRQETAYFKGKARSVQGVCMCPALTEYVAEHMKTDNEILKQRRKAVELDGLPDKGRKKQ